MVPNIRQKIEKDIILRSSHCTVNLKCDTVFGYMNVCKPVRKNIRSTVVVYFSLFAWFTLLKQKAFMEFQLWSRLHKSSIFPHCSGIEEARCVVRFAVSLTSCSQGSRDAVVEFVSSYISEIKCSAY